MSTFRDKINSPEGNGYIPSRHEGEPATDRYTRQIRNALVLIAILGAVAIFAGIVIAYHWGA
jgi:hypothetical protein